ncbi:hypothetical protein QUA40_27395 [Microcoleus sp. Pol11C3]|uniref:hypothetical protein n=1 Tax=Microcoleus sp. Pol11C3 TaxID=3055390 RepID=UPI002FD44C05
MERDGTIVDSSSKEKPYLEVNGKAQRLNIAKSQELLMRDAGQQLLTHFGNFNQITTSQQLSLKLHLEKTFVSVIHTNLM